MATACKLQVSVLARVMVEMGSCTQKEKITTSPNKTDLKKNKKTKSFYKCLAQDLKEMSASFTLLVVAVFM